MRIGLIGAIVLCLLASAALAAERRAAADCSAQPCVYVPLIRSDLPPTKTPTPTTTLTPTKIPTATATVSPTPTTTPTQTATPTPLTGIPTPAAPCDQNAPAPAEGAQAWMTVPNPARFSNTTVCARLIQNGQVVSGAAMSAVAHYKSTNTNLGPTTSGADGVGHVTFNIGGATAGFTVVVDVTIGGQATSTSFTP